MTHNGVGNQSAGVGRVGMEKTPLQKDSRSNGALPDSKLVMANGHPEGAGCRPQVQATEGGCMKGEKPEGEAQAVQALGTCGWTTGCDGHGAWDQSGQPDSWREAGSA